MNQTNAAQAIGSEATQESEGGELVDSGRKNQDESEGRVDDELLPYLQSATETDSNENLLRLFEVPRGQSYTASH